MIKVFCQPFHNSWFLLGRRSFNWKWFHVPFVCLNPNFSQTVKSDLRQCSDSVISQPTTPWLAGSMKIPGLSLALECGFHISFLLRLDCNAPRFILGLVLFSIRPKEILKCSVIYKHPLLSPSSSLFSPFHLPFSSCTLTPCLCKWP